MGISRIGQENLRSILGSSLRATIGLLLKRRSLETVFPFHASGRSLSHEIRIGWGKNLLLILIPIQRLHLPLRVWVSKVTSVIAATIHVSFSGVITAFDAPFSLVCNNNLITYLLRRLFRYLFNGSNEVFHFIFCCFLRLSMFVFHRFGFSMKSLGSVAFRVFRTSGTCFHLENRLNWLSFQCSTMANNFRINFMISKRGKSSLLSYPLPLKFFHQSQTVFGWKFVCHFLNVGLFQGFNGHMRVRQ